MVMSSVDRTRQLCQFALTLGLLLLVETTVLAQPIRPGDPFSRFRRRGRGSQVLGTINGTLMPARFSRLRDNRGYYWTVTSDGSVRAGSTSWFRSAQALTIDGSSFSSSSRMMTTGQEHVLTGTARGYRVTRRVKLVASEGYVRYLDSFTNPYSKPRSLRVVLITNLRYAPRAVLTDKAKRYKPKKSRIKTKGAIIVQSSSRPTILHYWAGTKSAKLAVNNFSSTNFPHQWAFRVELAPKQTLTLATAIAQRRYKGTPAKGEIRKLMRPFTSGKFLSGVPIALRKTIVNDGGGNTFELATSGQLLKDVDELATRWQIERKKDTLIVDGQTLLKGQAKASNVKVVTRFGTADIPFAEVAMIRGGNGQGNIPQVHLRNGEVLVGDAQLVAATLQTTAGIPIKLAIDRLHTLLLAKRPADGKPTKEMKLLVQTQSGNRFAIRDKPSVELNAATAWGRVKVPMDRVASLVMRRTPYPMQLVSLRDGSRLKALLSGSEVKVASLRFGAIPLTPITVSSITRIGSTRTIVTVPHFLLVGNNRLIGTFAEKTLRIRTSSGVVVVKSPEIESIEGNSGSLRVTTSDQKLVVGTPVDDVVSISSLGTTWKVPSRHLVGFTRPKNPAKSAAKKTADAKRRPDFDAGDAGVPTRGRTKSRP